MRRKVQLLIASLLIALNVLLAAAPTYAFDPFSGTNCSGSASSSALCSTKKSDPITGANGIIHKVTLIVALITGSVAVIIIIVAGFMYITSGGDPQKVSTAKNTIIYAVIGLVVIVAAQYIITFVVSKL